jgi:hypothetical protein
VKGPTAPTLVTSSREAMHKTRAEEELHLTAPCSSSYAAQMKTLEEHSSSDFTARENQHEETRPEQNRLIRSCSDQTITLQHHRSPTGHHMEHFALQHHRYHTGRHTEHSHRCHTGRKIFLVYCKAFLRYAAS